ncbi:biotin/lipoyl-binding protein, partial [Candidatus Falkowbacteria bacterium]|nr:biotin/lipoyl-binding protein [Candidatus Falkowbacteria bacterium]
MTLPVSYHQLEWYAEVPRSVRAHKVLGIALFVLALGGFAVWALTAPLAAALIAQGSFVATGKNQIVQHLEGGIIAEITVSEGDRVVAGQPIVRLDMTAANAR